MTGKRLRKLWSISLLVGSCAALIIIVTDITSVELPDTVKRILGVVCLAAIPVVAYTSVRLRIWEKQ